MAVGGAAGAVVRFGVSQWLTRDLPIATLLVNLGGSFLLGWLMASNPDDGVRLLVGVGFLGALTTLSTFSFETIDLLRAGRTVPAAGNVLLNGLGGPLMALLGWKLA